MPFKLFWVLWLYVFWTRDPFWLRPWLILGMNTSRLSNCLKSKRDTNKGIGKKQLQSWTAFLGASICRKENKRLKIYKILKFIFDVAFCYVRLLASQSDTNNWENSGIDPWTFVLTRCQRHSIMSVLAIFHVLRSSAGVVNSKPDTH